MGGRSGWRGPNPGPSGFSCRRRRDCSPGDPPSGSPDAEHEPALASSPSPPPPPPHAGRQLLSGPPSEPQRYPIVHPAANPVASPPFLGGPGGQSDAGPSSQPEGRRQRAPGSGQQRPRPSSEPQHLLYSKNPSQADIYSADEFRMYWFKVWPCYRADSHDRAGCPYAHPGEYARRRDPRTFNYSSFPCWHFLEGGCPWGDSCFFAHGVFESWLHPESYRTQQCLNGSGCSRRVCFFAHTEEEIRTPPKIERATPSLLPGSPSLASAATAPFADGINHNSLGCAQQQRLQSLGSHDLRPGIGVPSVVGLPSFELGSSSQDPDVSWVNSLLNSSSSDAEEKLAADGHGVPDGDGCGFEPN